MDFWVKAWNLIEVCQTNLFPTTDSIIFLVSLLFTRD